jgi:hypothetical protein
VNCTIPGHQSAEPANAHRKIKRDSNAPHGLRATSRLRRVVAEQNPAEEDKLIRDVQTARKREARATALEGEPSSLCRSLSRKGKRSRKGNRLPASFRQHSGVEAVLRGRRVSERQDSRRRLWLRSSAHNRSGGEFSAFRCVYLREE